MTASSRSRQLTPSEKRFRAHHAAATTFYIIAFFLFVLATYSWIHPRQTASQSARDAHLFAKRGEVFTKDLECRLIHNFEDKCKFVKENCQDEESGLFSYLQLYYCTLPHAQPVAFTIIALWLCFLFSTIGIAASDFFCINLSTISRLLGLSESLAGVTFLAFGNGSPDVFSTFAAMSTNSGSLAIGELIGAASFITAVVAGAMAFVRPFKVSRRSFVRDVSFFIVAATFAMVFMYDGKLYLWESIAMVGLYIFYVMFVVAWHWWFQRRKKRRLVEAAVRGNYSAAGSEVAEFPEYHDEDDAETSTRRTPQRGRSAEDIGLLERGIDGDDEEEDDDDASAEDRRRQELGDISNEMRLRRVNGLRRPRLRERRHTRAAPVRPSLIGALEFNSVMSGLQRSGNIQSFRLNRRHSDDGRFAAGGAPDARSMISEPSARYTDAVNVLQPGYGPEQGVAQAQSFRTRAVSAPDPSIMRQVAEIVDTPDLLGPLSEENASSRTSTKSQEAQDLMTNSPTYPTSSSSPPTSNHTSRSASPAPLIQRTNSMGAFLAIPGQQPNTEPELSSPGVRPQRPVVRIPSEASPFPQYIDSGISPMGKPPSLRLPSPMDGSASNSTILEMSQGPPKPPTWWPSRVLPSPLELWSTFFPTLCGWQEKNWWERLLGIAAAPSVIILTLTLPVVETDGDDSASIDEDIPDLTLPPTYEHSPAMAGPPSIIIEDEDHYHGGFQRRGDSDPFSKSFGGHGISATVPVVDGGLSDQVHQGRHTESRPAPHPHSSYRHQKAHSPQSQQPWPIMLTPVDGNITGSPEALPDLDRLPAPLEWNRWLVIVQVFTAPLLITLIIRMNIDPDHPRSLIRPVLISLACSLGALAVILTTTTPTRAPRWRIGLCFLGFLVSICWISSIADEVVGVLKTIGVILDISDAILGLTIFAVGNSLGDLVADYTVAKLGYPVMALSACFGGPMLNILLGVGLSGCYLIVKRAHHKHDHHPDHNVKFKPYHIDVSRTLMISGGTLLLTLLGLLIVVPLRRWKMDRVVGWGLVTLWTVSTVGNVLVEVTGVGEKLF